MARGPADSASLQTPGRLPGLMAGKELKPSRHWLAEAEIQIGLNWV